MSRKPHALCDVPSVNCYCGPMAGGVSIMSIESSHGQAGQKREARLLKPVIRVRESVGSFALLLVQVHQALESDGRNEKSSGHPKRIVPIAVHHESDDWHVKGQRVTRERARRH